MSEGGVVPVAILTTDEFDAGTVRPASVRFAGAAPRRWTMEDVDRDGDLDLLLNFRVRELELDGNSTEASLTARPFRTLAGCSSRVPTRSGSSRSQDGDLDPALLIAAVPDLSR